MKYAGKKTLFLMHAWSPRKFVYCCEFNHSFAQNIIFLTNIIFIQGAFKNIQGLLWKIQGIFKGIAQVFIFQGLSKDIMLFQGLFQGLCEPCHRVRKRAFTKGQALEISSCYYEHDHRLFTCKCPQSSFIHSKIFQSDRIQTG